MSDATTVQIAALISFALAIAHTFFAGFFQSLAKRYKKGSVGESVFHLLGEVEVVFGIWAATFLFIFAFLDSAGASINYLESRNFTEPMFVFVIMAVCSARPILEFAESLILGLSRVLPMNPSGRFYVSALIVGPLLGSFITEPAAMTVTALILHRRFYGSGMSEKFKYATLGLLFVNISIGGTLTPYAAPPVLMVAAKWGWDLNFMLLNFGWKAAIAVVLSTAVIAFQFKKDLAKFSMAQDPAVKAKTPIWVLSIHLFFVAGIVAGAHHPVVFVAIFLMFLGVSIITSKYQDALKIREALLVGSFLSGLVVLGGMQNFWLEPILTRLEALPLYLGSIGLTAFTDNAAITYLGAQVEGLSYFSKYALVAGSVVGGGLTVIANAPNPAGYGILNSSFQNDGISPVKLILSAAFPTLIAALCFWLL